MSLPSRDLTRQLADGRTQQWLELGPSTSPPVLFCHGGNDCRLEARWIAPAVAAAGIRLITLDRAGFGGSTFSPSQSFVSGTDEVTGLLDHLGLDAVRVIGLSGGGPHALALAAAAPDRVTSVDLVASPCPWDQPGFLDGTWLPIRLTYLLARYAPDWMFFPLQRAMNDAERNLTYADRMPAPDARLLRDHPEVGQAMVTSVTAAHADGYRGAVQEWRHYTQPWGFALENVHASVRLWYGTDDGMAPPSMGEVLHRRLPNALLTIVPDRAHLSIFVREAHRFLQPQS
jgi:pimeloyl-ACP methyl ester carboxylesterase